MEQFADAEEEDVLSQTETLVSSQPPMTAPLAPVFDDGVRLGRVDDSDRDDDTEQSEFEEWDSQDEAEYRAQHAEQDGINDVVDQDWADAAGDFTKKFNRLRQHVSATASANSGTPSGGSHQPSKILPAINKPKQSLNARASSTQASTGSTGIHLNKVADQLAMYSRFERKVTLDPLYASAGQAPRKGGSEKILVKDKSDRATNEQVLDPRTRLILFKMLGRGLIERIDGCVSTGKEANVYHAVTPENRHLALKIYKTSILVFKDRDRYVTGEYRFKSGYARSNPRKMVRLWAEKELRNLRRMHAAGLRVPEALEVRENVLVMEFVGADEWQASPRLKDAHLPLERVRDLYIEILVLLRAMFVRCRLVHADFSEYNILYHDEHLWVIDVSQSVEQDHPSAFDFLRADIRNADEFFAKRGVATLGITKTFNYVTRDSSFADRGETDAEMTATATTLVLAKENDELPEDDVSAGMKDLSLGKDDAGARLSKASLTETDEAVFAQSYIPRALNDVYDVERDVAKVIRGESQDLIYAELTGVGRSSHRAKVEEGAMEDAESQKGDEQSDADSDASDSDSGSDSDEFEERRPRGKKHEDKDEKKKRRQEVKEVAREKRAHKMKKHEKARRVKKTSGKR
ncbi:Serine/threonine-protein kinase rio1 [Microbotryomycetes sp. JL221]|nr:Serine/threonine-protein kinase rio1 [Microbotryomycetes sp. JL221]